MSTFQSTNSSKCITGMASIFLLQKGNKQTNKEKMKMVVNGENDSSTWSLILVTAFLDRQSIEYGGESVVQFTGG